MHLARSAFLAVGVVLTACSTGYARRPLDDRRVLEDLRSVQLEMLHPACPPTTAAGPTAFEPSDGLSIDEAVAVGLCANPELRAFRAQRGVAEGEVVAAGVLPNPELELQWLHIEQ